jgi:hypothetical protein
MLLGKQSRCMMGCNSIYGLVKTPFGLSTGFLAIYVFLETPSRRDFFVFKIFSAF